jgi:cellulose biosynthesis protein BcsQ
MMNKITFDEDGYPRIYTIHSQKGGVGKSSIALALAGLSGARKKKTLIIDADMTGASIADVPGMECEPGSNFNKLILAKPNEFLQLTAIWPAPKGNEPTDLERQFCRKKVGHESLFFIPSSAGAADVETIVPLISQEDHLHFFRHRIEDILAAAIRSGFETIILDHSPGLFGFSKTTLEMSLEWSPPLRADHRLQSLLNGKKPEPTLQSLLVSSFEPHDFKAILGSFQYVLERIKKPKKLGYASFIDTFGILFNKAGQISDSIKEVDEKILAKVRYMDLDLKQIIKEHEKEYGSMLAPFIEGFDMGDICSKAEAFVSQDERGPINNKWENWFFALGCRARMIKAQEGPDFGKAV